MDENFISNLLLDLCNVFIIVVRNFTIEEQIMIEKIKLKNATCQIFVIHNYSEVTSIEILDQLWKEKVVGIFDGSELDQKIKMLQEEGKNINKTCLFGKRQI